MAELFLFDEIVHFGVMFAEGNEPGEWLGWGEIENEIISGIMLSVMCKSNDGKACPQ